MEIQFSICKAAFQMSLIYQVSKVSTQSIFLDMSALSQKYKYQDETCLGDYYDYMAQDCERTYWILDIFLIWMGLISQYLWLSIYLKNLVPAWKNIILPQYFLDWL